MVGPVRGVGLHPSAFDPLVDTFHHRKTKQWVPVRGSRRTGDGIVDAVELHGGHRPARMDGRQLDLAGDGGNGRHMVGGLRGHGIRHHAAIGYSGDVDPPKVDGGPRCDVGNDLEQESDVVDVPVTGRPQHLPAFQPYCSCLAMGSGVSTLEILVPSG